MRPILLTLQAFGPFAEKQVIDFRSLGRATFFLICGPTGSGKTTILDGITFALYGDSSGEERDVRKMRSDHAAPTCITEVYFDFSLGSNVYRIFRSPEQMRPRRKGGGITIKKAEAVLWKRTGSTLESEDGHVLARGYTEVTNQICDLLGFRSDQFRQVVMLPQGKFRDFLLAGSNKREEILETLFRTERFRFIQDRLKEEAKKVEQEYHLIDGQKEKLLIHAGVRSIDELKDRGKELERLTLDAAKQIEKEREKEEKARQTLEKARQTVITLEEWREAEAALAMQGARKKEMQKKEETLDLAQKALPLIEKEKEYIESINDHKKSEARVQELRIALQQAMKEKEEALHMFEKEEARQDQRQEHEAALRRLNELGDKADELKKKKAELETIEQRLTATIKENGELTAAIEVCQQRLEQRRKDQLEIEKAQAALPGLEKTCEQMQREIKCRNELLSLEKELAVYEAAYDTAKAALDHADELYRTTQQELDGLRHEWSRGQAGILARTLVHGKPCPVCGSSHHPNPAHFAENLPAEEEIRKKEETCKAYEKARDRAIREEGETARKMGECRARIALLEESLTGKEDDEMSRIEEELAAKVKECKQTQQMMEKSGTIGNEIKVLISQEKALSEKLETVKAGIMEQKENRAVLRSFVEEYEKIIEPRLRVSGAIEMEKEEEENALTELKNALQASRIRLEDASEHHTAVLSRLKEAEEHRKAAKEKEARIHGDFIYELEKNGFESEEAFTEARMSREDIRMLEKEIKDFSGDMKAAELRCRRAKKKAAGLERPDIDKLSSYADQARAGLEKRVEDKVRLVNQKEQVDTAIAGFKDLEKKLSLLETQYRVLGTLADVANGKNELRLTFQRFVLTTLLDDVLLQASKRLSLMSKGRFSLRRAEQPVDRRIASGLDLEVDDAYTGTSRPASTLSGGESFLAALSLALGLADVVQAYAGGVYLDTVFIDEGFGSLDAESLDYAVQSLFNLQTKGRLVAVISHVAELRERIDTRLEVIAGKTGSSARFVRG